jgi:hypothetical protein
MGYLWIKRKKIWSFWEKIIGFNEINFIEVVNKQRERLINECFKDE